MSEYEQDVNHCRYFPGVYSPESYYSSRRNMAGCQYRKQCVGKTDDMAADRDKKKGLRLGTSTMLMILV